MYSALDNKILAQWTGHGSLESIETIDLEKWVETHPYSASLQYLLAKKYALVGSPLFQEQVQNTTSYFPTALHLHQILQEHEKDTIADPLDDKGTNLISEQCAQFKEPIETIDLA